MRCLSVACRRFILVVFSGLVGAFSVLPADPRQPPIMVYDRGSMKDMYGDNAAAKVNLSELKDTEHLYALGTLSGLRGEILIWDSQPQESWISSWRVQAKSDWGESAAYLVWASVPRWQKTRVPPSVRSLECLEMWLASMSGKPGSPLPGQYPFLIKGHFGRIVWHIANFHDDGKSLTRASEQAQKFHGESSDLHGEIVGFYSPDHQGFFIPEGRRTHMHLRVSDKLVAHVDDFDPFGDTGLALYVPSR